MILKVPSDTEVTLTAEVDPANESATYAWTRAGTPFVPRTAGKHVFTAGKDSWGEYQVVATVNGTALPPAAVSVVERVAEEQAEPDDEDKVAEIAPGEYDPKFALISGIAAAVAAVLVVLLLTVLMFGIDLPGTVSTVGDNQQITGTWAQRFSGVLALILAAIGAIIIFGGLWLAALETRGRLRAQQAIAERGALDGVAEVLDKARLLRGTIAVLSAGVAILVVASLIAIRLAGAESGADPQVNPSAPATSSVAPSASPAG